jgi:membrane-associated protein
MEFFQHLIEIILHLDKFLPVLCAQYGTWIYAILFTVVFCETGLVVTPFLPGDSLLFAVGAVAALGGAMRVEFAAPLLVCAALGGDNTNYWIGRTMGPKVFSSEHSRLFNKEYLERTRLFYEKYGKIAVIIARFLPIIRTFAPFVAGIGKMRYRIFLLFSIIGAMLWVGLFTLTGYYFGTIPFIRQNFSLVVVALVLIPGLPALIGFVRQFRAGKKKKTAGS